MSAFRNALLQAIDLTSLDLSGVIVEIKVGDKTYKTCLQEPFPKDEYFEITNATIDKKFVWTFDVIVPSEPGVTYKGVRSAPIEDPFFVYMQTLSIDTSTDRTVVRHGKVCKPIGFDISVMNSTEGHEKRVADFRKNNILAEKINFFVGGESVAYDRTVMKKHVAMYREFVTPQTIAWRHCASNLSPDDVKEIATFLGIKYDPDAK